MDPDGLTLLAAVVLGAAACALYWRAGALCAHGEERAAGARLGFSDKSIGVFVLAGLCAAGAAAAAFFWCARMPGMWWGLAGLALLAVFGVLCFALGAACGKEGGWGGPAGFAGITGTSINGVFAVYSSCQYLGNGCLTGTPGTAEKICMSDSISFYLIFQCCNDMFLSFYIFKVLGPELSVQSCIAHESSPLLSLRS